MTTTPEKIIEAHQKAYPSSSDETWDTNAVCGTCNHPWPCDTAVLGELLTETAKLRPQGNPMTAEVWVLIKQRDDDSISKVLGVYDDYNDLLSRVGRIGKANSQYELTQQSTQSWRIGPPEGEDEGFFGNSPVYLTAYKAPYHSADPTPGSRADDMLSDEAFERIAASRPNKN